MRSWTLGLVLGTCCLSAAQAISPIPYWQEFGPAAVVPVAPQLRRLQASAGNRSPVKQLVIAGLQSGALPGMKTWVRRQQLSEPDLSILFAASRSNIAVQPLGLQAALQGAHNRLQQAMQQYQPQPDRGFCAVEAFFTRPEIAQPRHHLLLLWQGWHEDPAVFLSPGIEIEEEFYDLALDQGGMAADGTGAKIRVATVLQQAYGVNESNWQQFVTHAHSSYQSLLADATEIVPSKVKF